MALAFVDQIVSSGSNFLCGLVVARFAGLTQFGVFAVAFSIWVIAQSLVRSLLVQPYMVERRSTTGLEGPSDWHLQRVVLSSGVVMGLLLGVGSLAVASGTYRSVLLALGVFLPFLLLQDAIRFIGIANQRIGATLTNDVAFLVLQLLLLLLIRQLGNLTAAASVVAWGFGAVVGCLLGLLQFSSLRTVRNGSAEWAREAVATGRWFAASAIVFAVGTNGSLLLLSAGLGSDAVGGVRSVLNLLAPTQVLAAAVESMSFREAVSRLELGRTAASRFARSLSGRLVIVTLLYGLALTALNSSVLGTVFGSDFGRFHSLIMPAVLSATAGALAIGPIQELRAARQGRRLLYVQCLAFSGRIAVGVLMLVVASAGLFMWATALITIFQSSMYWGQFRRYLQRTESSVGHEKPTSTHYACD